MASAETLFPEPDSPTTARHSPLPMEKETFSTTLITPAAVLKEMLRSFTSITGAPFAPLTCDLEDQVLSAGCRRSC